MTWYPDDVGRRRIQASFFVVRSLKQDFERVHETQLVDHLDDLYEYLEPTILPTLKMVILDGALSLNVDGEELLGPEGWIGEFTTAFSGPDTRRADGGPIREGYSDGMAYEFYDQGDVSRFRLYRNNRIKRELSLPANDLKLEWALMVWRVIRLKAALGDEGDQVLLNKRLAAGPGSESLYGYTISAPLEQVFSNPVPAHLPIPRRR